MIKKSIIEIIYLLSSIIFILGFKYLSNPKRSRTGNMLMAGGMLAAIFITFLDDKVKNLTWIISGIIIGSVIGVIYSKKLRIQFVPQIMSFFNGLGGIVSVLLCFLQFKLHPLLQKNLVNFTSGFLLLGVFLGSISFSGSLIVIFRYFEWIKNKSIEYPLQKTLNLLLFLIVLSVGVFILFKSQFDIVLLFSFTALSFLLGSLLTLPIIGKEVLVLSSFLNSITGFVITVLGIIMNNQIMIIGGIFVASCGFVLSSLLAHSINQSIFSILFFRKEQNLERILSPKGEILQETNISDAAILLANSPKVIIIAGYGLSISGAHFACKELETILEERGVEVKYAVHPLAGRMPGHISILLLEAKIEYEKILDLDKANRELKTADLAFVIGANDIINPKENIPYLLGFPSIDILSAKNILILNRSPNLGYLGLQNSAFSNEKTKFLLGDAKNILQKLIDEILKIYK
jgi:NAD(P) transhydrogenase subunit beta